MTQIYNQRYIGALHERPSNYERLQAPYYPREAPRTEAAASYTERKVDKSWSPPCSPASESSKHSRDQEKMYNGPESKAPREQLPSLSSLFPATSHPPPAQSPYSERPSPVFTSTNTSPLDGRHPATPIHPDRPFDSNSYFHRPAQPVPHSRPEAVERLGFLAHSVTTQSSVKPESSRYEGRPPYSINTSRTPGPPVNSWSPRSQSNRPEYFSRDTSSSFVHHVDRPNQPQRHDEMRSAYRDGNHITPLTPDFPPTPASTVIGELTTSKDGLGPKIWTGTQFLPRFVRQAEVSGEGTCYFYDDGTHCKTVIDGEVVNAHWGVTKAGKPRKRLAIACITCREKKIKCDPDYPRCVQCEKFGRICKFKNAPRGGQGSPDTPPADVDDTLSRPPSSRADGESLKLGARENSEPISPRHVVRHVSPVNEEHPSKRQRTAYNHFTPVPSEGSPPPSAREAGSPPAAWLETAVNRFPDQDSVQQSRVNPYMARPAIVSELLDSFFTHVPETASSIFPRAAFRSWFVSNGPKSSDDLMLMYTVLALASIFSPKLDHRALGAQYASIARYTCENRRFSIQLVQSRLLLSLYYFSTNNSNDAWDFCGAAVRAANGLRFNVEIEKSEENYLQTFPYGLNRHGYAECRRRTFWSCYLMDRFNGFCSGHFSMMQAEDVFLRLPCDDSSFTSQVEVQNPFFDVTTPPIPNHIWTIGPMAHLINLATIWGDVMANIYRTSQRRAPAHSASFGKFYEATSQRLRDWNTSLPKAYNFSAENLRKTADNEKMNTFVMMHAVFHTTSMKLNRYIQQANLTPAQLSHHISAAQHHAEALLAITDALASRRSSLPSSPTGYSMKPASLSSPFVAYAIVSAVDILTARIPVSAVPSRLASIRGAQTVLADLAPVWQSAKTQQALVVDRVRDLTELAADPGTNSSSRFGSFVKHEGREVVFEMRDSIEKTFARDFDCIYG